MKIKDAEKLLSTYVKSETLTRHCRTVAAVMKYFAEKYGEPDPEFWECVGLLHDIDFEMYPDEHCIKAKEILESERKNYLLPDQTSAITDELIHAVQSHGWNICCEIEPAARMEKVLYTIDELTGLIFACAMARPSKSVADMETKSVMKKFKTPAFAAGCSRDVIRRGAELMGAELTDIIGGCIEAMRQRHEELGV
ncbi:MAG: HD domain-containing protein [Bacteroides sp.]|nr:HD domain-containing protein [Prevotella sp.]MCM1407582.1 HD domain-containing protein [Treponema brennaborense]MCM1469268.1 HD domain-containing protein [Bacteroides sp.]